MERKSILSRLARITTHPVLASLGFVVCFMSCAAAQRTAAPLSSQNKAVRATHILGFESVHHNAGGRLRIAENTLQFEKGSSVIGELNLNSIQNISLGVEDNQLGGTPMMVGKAAVPFGGGRVISLFTHKKYDSLTIEYLDSNGGFHEAVFRLKKGQGPILKGNLISAEALMSKGGGSADHDTHLGEQK